MSDNYNTETSYQAAVWSDNYNTETKYGQLSGVTITTLKLVTRQLS